MNEVRPFLLSQDFLSIAVETESSAVPGNQPLNPTSVELTVSVQCACHTKKKISSRRIMSKKRTPITAGVYDIRRGKSAVSILQIKPFNTSAI